jgi:nicotinate-nucleotide adenylyltransferase
MRHVPIAVMARPGTRLEGRGSRAAEEYARYRLPAEAAKRLASTLPPAWVFLDMPLNDLSSSAIRARGEWRAGRSAKGGRTR